MEKEKNNWLSNNAGGIIGGLTTIGSWLGIGEGRQDRRQVEQQKKLNEVNAGTSKELADYEQQLKMKMWKDTNYGAQLKEADKAGVSKAAVLGGSGTGTQGASVSGVSGTGAADAASSTNARTAQMQAGMQLASQLALQKAQKENIEADTANKLQGAGKAGAEKTGIDIDNEVKNKTQGDAIRKIVFEADKALGESMSAFQKGRIDEDTREDQIKKIKAEGISAVLETQAKKIGMNLDKAKIKEISEKIAQGWEGLKQGQEKIAIDKFKEEVKANYPGIFDVGGRIIEDTIEGLFDITNKNRKIYKKIN